MLDFERESEYILVLSAQNPVALVRGRYGPASTATVSIFIDDINEGPVLSQSHYEVTVREGEEPGRVIATIRAYDPDSHPVRQGLFVINFIKKTFLTHIFIIVGKFCRVLFLFIKIEVTNFFLLQSKR